MSDTIQSVHQAIKEKIEKVKAEKSRLAGEISAKQQQLKQLSDRCEKEFGVTVDKLPGLLEEYRQKITDFQAKACQELGIVGLPGNESFSVK